MRIGAALSIGLLLATVGSTAAYAGKEIYLNGGVSINNLKDDAELFGLGLAAGLETEVGGTWTSDMEGRTGFDGGAGFRFSKSGSFGMAVELRYVNRGTRYKLEETSGTNFGATGTWKLNYVEVPVLVWITPSGSGKVKPVMMLGPVLGIKASSDFEVEANGQSQTVDLGEQFKSTAFAGLFGAGARFTVSPRSSFDLEARYQLGLTNLLDTPSASFKSTGFSILAGWTWAVGN